MNLDQLLGEIERLRGLVLKPLGRARTVRVVEVDRVEERVIIEVGEERARSSRTFGEFEKLLSALNTTPAIHVDSILSGSGSSRNQPETILANLPSIEVLYVAGRKHLARVNESRRSYGTVEEMDPIRAQEVAAKLAASGLRARVSVLIVSDDLVRIAKRLSIVTSSQTKMLSDQVAAVGEGVDRMWIARPSIGLPAGVYPMLEKGAAPSSAPTVTLGFSEYSLVVIDGVTVLVKSSD